MPGIKKIAEHVMKLNPDPIVRFKIIKDILKLDVNDPEYHEARKNISQGIHIKKLEQTQLPDGSWGCFHGGRQKGKKQIWTTEIAVARAVVLGLDKDHDILKRVQDYIVRVLEKKTDIPDYQEKNDRWETGKNLFLSSTLALIDPAHPLVKESINLWERLSCRIFASGSYDQEAEIEAHKEFTGASVKDSYLSINNKYSLILLGRSRTEIKKKYEKSLLHWLFNRKDGIGYQNVSLSSPPQSSKPGFLDRWFNSHEILSSFDSWKNFAGDFFKWIRLQRKNAELWDLGPRVKGDYSYYFPLSESWRKIINRKIDWTARILALLDRCL